jgi:hypothetical protein
MDIKNPVKWPLHRIHLSSMCEAIGVAVSLANILSICGNITKAVYANVQNAGMMDDSIRSLQDEVELLKDVVNSFDRGLKAPCLAHVPDVQTQLSGDRWYFVKQSLSQCQFTLQNIESTLVEVQPKPFTLAMLLGPDVAFQKVARLGQQVADCRQRLLSLITLFVPCLQATSLRVF